MTAPIVQFTGPSFKETDKLDLSGFCKKLERYLIVESDFVEGSLVVALNAAFGNGKTTFINMWKNDLLVRRLSSCAEAAFTAPMPMILNAWESDFCKDPLVAILAGLADAVKSWTGDDAPKNGVKSKFLATSKKAALFTAAVVNGVAAKFTGADLLKSDEFVQKEADKSKPKDPDFIALYQHRQKVLHDLRQSLEDTFSSKPPSGDETTIAGPSFVSPKVIVFVDELDRCRPDYAIHYLETIKHVFNIKGMIFLLAVDASQLEVSAKALFGNGLKFPEYFRKFCHRSFDLPEPEEGPMGTLLEELVAKHVTRRGLRSSAFKEGEYVARMTVPLVRAWKMNPRQLHESFRILGHALSITGKHGEMRTHNTTVSLAYLYLCLIRIAEPETYQQLRLGSFSLDHIRFFFHCHHKDSGLAVYWAELYLIGTEKNVTHLDSQIRDQLTKVRGDLELDKSFSKLRDALGHYPAPFKQICQRIESAMMFEEGK